jgi:hypothetical protein
MSRSFTRYYHSYKYIPAVLVIMIFAFALFYNIVGGFLSDGMPVAFVISEQITEGTEDTAAACPEDALESECTEYAAEDGTTTVVTKEKGSPVVMLLMHFMMLALIFVTIVLVAFAFDAKHEPRQFITRAIKTSSEHEAAAKLKKEQAKLRLHKAFKSGFSRHHIRESLLDKGHSEKDVDELLDRHRIR